LRLNSLRTARLGDKKTIQKSRQTSKKIRRTKRLDKKKKGVPKSTQNALVKNEVEGE